MANPNKTRGVASTYAIGWLTALVKDDRAQRERRHTLWQTIIDIVLIIQTKQQQQRQQHSEISTSARYWIAILPRGHVVTAASMINTIMYLQCCLTSYRCSFSHNVATMSTDSLKGPVRGSRVWI